MKDQPLIVLVILNLAYLKNKHLIKIQECMSE